MAKRALLFISISAFFALYLSARDALSQDDLKMLQEPGGWEYITISDTDAGIQTQHTCFDGTPHPNECSGTLTLRSDNTFVQRVYIHHQSVARHGTYELDGDQLTFFDEFGTKDGPYTIALDSKKKLLTMDMPQVHIQLELEREYRRMLQKSGQPQN
jgi:hypothetical protein